MAETSSPVADSPINDPVLRRALFILLAFFTLYTFGRFGIDQVRPPGLIPNDYVNFHRASDRLARGIQVYQPDDDSPYKYSPTFLLGFSATFNQLPHKVAWALWCALSIAGFAAATLWLWQRSLGGLKRRTVAGLIAAFTVFAWHGYLEHFSYGQGDMFLFAIFIGAVAARRDWIAAALMSAILITKPQGAILLAYFLIARRWRMLGLTSAMTLLLLALPIAYWGVTKQLAMFSQWWLVLQAQRVEFMTGNLNQSVAATLARLSGHRPLVNLLTPLGVALGGLLALATCLRRPLPRVAPTSARVRLAVGTVLLYAAITPLSWRWFTFYWLPVGVCLAATALRQRSVGALMVLTAFALNGVLLQTFVAHALGVAEVDELSKVGLYTLGNLLLAAAYLLTSARRPHERSRA